MQPDPPPAFDLGNSMEALGSSPTEKSQTGLIPLPVRASRAQVTQAPTTTQARTPRHNAAPLPSRGGAAREAVVGREYGSLTRSGQGGGKTRRGWKMEGPAEKPGLWAAAW